MIRFLRAWAWVRWRVRMNAIERSDRSDIVQRFTRATEVIGPVLLALMLVPAALVAAAIGLAAGYGLGAGAEWGEGAMHVIRLALVAALILTVVASVAFPSGHGLGSLPRLLLLPISRRALFAGEVVGSLAEPWMLMTLLGTVMLVGGALASASFATAIAGVAGAVLLLVTFAGLGALFGALLHIVLGNRRRGEWLLVGLLTAVSLLSMLPMLLQSGTRAERDRIERDIEGRLATHFETPASGYLAVLPTELYVASVARAAGAVPGNAVWPLAGLGAMSLAALGGGWIVWQKAIDHRGSSSSRGRARRGSTAHAPAMSSAMSSATVGVAYTFVQHVVRTARGRATVLPSVLMTLVFAGLVAFRDGFDLGFAAVRDGFAVAVFGTAIAFMTPVQLWMNQFAIDKAGLTMLCLQPLSSADILRGKAAGAAALVAALTAVPCLLGLLIGSPVHPAYWAVLALGAVAAFAILAPLAALLSILFPKHVDLTSIGSRSNAHPIASLAGAALTFAAGAPPAAAAIAGFRVMDSPSAAVGLTALWLVLAAGIGWLLQKLAVRLFDRRREALVGVAAGR